ncbi:MAG: exodeoxyribonuclease VII large subunit, partial [Gammaproteobacteria bacterium]|nr:exodeoxyribonuclease VII large subunit [Gammaproteobacteria bacterium]
LISLNASGQQRRSASLGSLAVKLETLSPLATLQRGFAIVSSEPDGNILASSTEVNPGDKVKARLSDGTFTAEIISTEN